MIEVLKQAFDVLNDVWNSRLPLHNVDDIRKAKASLRQAIAELESQEPVACPYCHNSATLGAVYFDQNCVGCVKRMSHPPQRTEQEPVAWRTFDGEGGYDYRSYEDNESYADEWDKRNPNHKGWVDKLYTTPPPCPTCEALARTVMMDQTGRDA